MEMVSKHWAAKMFVWVFRNILLFGQPNIYLLVTTKIKLICIASSYN